MKNGTYYLHHFILNPGKWGVVVGGEGRVGSNMKKWYIP